MSEQKLNAAILSLQGAFNVLPKNQGVLARHPKPTRKQPRSIERLARELKRQMQVQGKDDDVKVEFASQGELRIVLPNQVLFGSASADLREGSLPILEAVAALLAEMPDDAVETVEVRGHTDSRPLAATRKFRDNYDLSYFRADAVTRVIEAAGAVDAGLFERVACGPDQPVATNETPEGMAANRRVEVYVRGVKQDEDEEVLVKKFSELKLRPQP